MGGDNFFNSVTHIIIDEVHERDKMCDFLLTILKVTKTSMTTSKFHKNQILLCNHSKVFLSVAKEITDPIEFSILGKHHISCELNIDHNY